eukprot:CAMPEP_0114999986 /NCGR_PEP_ID=MMETSP0216-20121206/16481_1 /TAXON_ID=223996 /ORGANISM="Protocruzia adherens, Strain Boccale" /LENGTH=537 /DNA_ID=CAMNT_0002364983 /DNA_START=103 /DNA_END=1716 /DNA_ORIENTATION=+
MADTVNDDEIVKRPKPQPEWVRNCFMSLLVTIMGVTYLDNTIIPNLLTQIKDDLHINNFKGGLLASLNLASSLIAGLFFAYSTRKFHRWTLLLFGMCIWTGGIVLCYFSHNYATLVVARIVSGLGQAPTSVLEPPLLNDVAPFARKAIWIGINNITQSIGSAIGPLYASHVESATGHWQTAFLVELFIVATLLAIGIFPPFYRRFKASAVTSNKSMTASLAHAHASFAEPIAYNEDEFSQGGSVANDRAGSLENGADDEENRRQSSPAADSSRRHSSRPREQIQDGRKPVVQELKNLAGNSVYVLFVIGMIMSFFSFGAFGGFANVYLQDEYGMSTNSASLTVSIINLGSGFISTPAGALLYDWMVKKKQPITRQYRAEVACRLLYYSYVSSMLVALPCTIIRGQWVFIIGMGFAVSLVNSTAAINTLVCINCVPEHAVDMAMAVNVAFFSCFGTVPAPTVFGALSDAYGLYTAMIISFCPLIVASFTGVFTWICSTAPGYPFKVQFKVWMGRETLENLKARDIIAGDEKEKLLDNN